MAASDDITAFAQSVYSRIKNRFYDTITSTDGINFIAMVTDFANGFIDELELELDAGGNPIDWWWVRSNGFTLGTATTGATSIACPSTINNLIAEEGRYVQIVKSGLVVAQFSVVSPGDFTNDTSIIQDDMCARIGTTIVFSRPFTALENTGTIIGDVTTPIPRLVWDSVTPSNCVSTAIITTIKPRELFVLGVAKNASLPDIVQGKLSPSFVQKFDDMLTNAVARSAKSSKSDTAQRDNFGYISGVGF